MPTGKRPATPVEGPTAVTPGTAECLLAPACGGRAGAAQGREQLYTHEAGQHRTQGLTHPASRSGTGHSHGRHSATHTPGFPPGTRSEPFLRRPGRQHVWGANDGPPAASCTAHQMQMGFTFLRHGKKQTQEHTICNRDHMWPAKSNILTFQLFTEFADLSDAEDTLLESSPPRAHGRLASAPGLGSRTGLRSCTERPLGATELSLTSAPCRKGAGAWAHLACGCLGRPGSL